MKTREFEFASATGVCRIFGCEYLPDNGEVRAVVALHHGMAEHQGRYKAFIEYLTEQGFAVFMHDMANHGKSNQNKKETGYFGKKDGYKALVSDFRTVFLMAKESFPDKKTVVMGHSMGSFIVRCFTAWYPNAGFSGAIYMGTGGANPIAPIGDFVSSAAAKLEGSLHKSKLIDKMTFGSYNNKFEKRTAFDWLTRDTEIVDKYIADEYCGFLFSTKGMNDLVKLNIHANSEEWYAHVPKDIPILVVSGEMDPVGNYGQGVKEIHAKLKSTGHSKAVLKLYKDARHEVLNEINKEEVYKDISSFIETEVLGD